FGIEFQENEYKDGESPERRTAIADKGQRNSHNRRQTDRHSDIDEQVDDQNTGHAVAVYARKFRSLPFGEEDEPQDHYYEEDNHGRCPQKTPFFANGAKDKVGALHRYVLVLRQRAV